MAYAKRSFVKRFDAPTPVSRPIMRTPSTYQKAILDWIVDGEGSAIVDAKAGSGKTSTLEMIAWQIKDSEPSASAVFLAFNASISAVLTSRLPYLAPTFHKLAGGAAFRFCKSTTGKNMPWNEWLDINKVSAILDLLFPTDKDAHAAVRKLVSIMKASVLMPDASQDVLLDLMAHFAIESESERVTDDMVISMARDVLAANNKHLVTADFDDMLYFVEIFGIRLDTYDYVFVDESQDTNEVQRAILRRLMHRGSRLVAVGDPHQAIYGFRGASHDAMDLIASEFDCVTFPLSISYRCARSIVEHAQEYVPDILPRDNAPDGTVSTADVWCLTDFLPSDIVLCRNTAPLVQIAYRMLARRIGVRIAGRDIGQGLVTLIRKLAGKRGTLDTLMTRVEQYRETEVSKAMSSRLEGKAQSIADKCDSIVTLVDSMTNDDTSRGIEGLVSIITELFDDKKRGVITLSTVHKAKGTEADRVFILDSHLMPSKYARQEWQIIQESNLQYVAITRAMQTLTYISSEGIE